MTEEQGTVELVLSEVSKAFHPLTTRMSSGNIRILLSEMGIRLPVELEGKAGFMGSLENTISLVSVLVQLLDELKSAIDAEDYATAVQKGIEMLQVIFNLLDSFVNVSTQLDSIKNDFSGIDPADIEAFALQLPERLSSYLLANYIEGYYPIFASILSLVGILEAEEVDGDAVDASKPEFIRRTLHFDRVFDLLDPAQAFRDRYGWGDAGFDAELFLQRIHNVLSAFAVPIAYEPATPTAPASLTTHWFSLSTATDIAPAGLQLELTGSLPAEAAITFPFVMDGWNLEIGTNAELQAGLGVKLRPPADLEITPPTGSAQGEVSFTLIGGGTDGDGAFVILNQNGVGRLQVGQISTGIGAGFLWSSANGQAEGTVKFEVGIRDGVLIIDGGDSDGFLSTILPEDGITSRFDVVAGISSVDGLYFEGSATLEINLPLHIDLTIIKIDSLIISAGISDGNFVTALGVNASANLGPLAASVENIGLKALLDFSSSEKNLGFADIDFKFKPPNGVGLSIDAAVVKGGGFLRFNPEKEEYDGILELDLSGIVAVKAIGLITTRLPDGSKGFSLLLIITAEFGSPIQLGYGFTLSGVGGLLGLNRTMRLEMIATGIRDGGINSIMFPQNVIENAPRIISDLKKYFPAEDGTFLIGPMVMIGWGTPNLVAVSLGVIIEIPGNIAILGILKLALPDEDAALIVIQVNFIGAIEFDKKRLWFFASVFESRVLFLTLDGEMGLLVSWGNDANFVLSVGGFHPAFNPPALPFGAIVRIAINILNTSFARIRIEGYFAVTSNTVQFGAKVELFFGVDAFNIDGHLAFDALFRFSPFYFIITISASLSVKVFGIGLFSVRMRGELEGPTPWHVEGTGSISLLFWDIDVDFSHTWGNEEDTTLPPITVMPLLMAEFEKMENWQAVLPDSNRLLVSLREIEQSTTDLILHPVGSLKVSQRFVPLGITIDKVGNQKPEDANAFSVDLKDGSGLAKIANVTEPFATGQYISKSDGALLSSKSFEPIISGIEMAVEGEQYRSPRAVRRVVRYEKIIIDSFYKRFVRPFFTAIGSLFSLFLKGNAISRSALSYKKQKQLQPFAEKVAVGNTLYGVASTSDNTAFNAESINFTSQVQAEDYLRKQVKDDASLADQLHVIPQVEMQEAA